MSRCVQELITTQSLSPLQSRLRAQYRPVHFHSKTLSMLAAGFPCRPRGMWLMETKTISALVHRSFLDSLPSSLLGPSSFCPRKCADSYPAGVCIPFRSSPTTCHRQPAFLLALSHQIPCRTFLHLHDMSIHGNTALPGSNYCKNGNVCPISLLG